MKQLDIEVLDYVNNNKSSLIDQVHFLRKSNPVQNKLFKSFLKEILEVEPTNTEELVHGYATFIKYHEAWYPGLKVNALSQIIPDDFI